MDLSTNVIHCKMYQPNTTNWCMECLIHFHETCYHIIAFIYAIKQWYILTFLLQRKSCTSVQCLIDAVSTVKHFHSTFIRQQKFQSATFFWFRCISWLENASILRSIETTELWMHHLVLAQDWIMVRGCHHRNNKDLNVPPFFFAQT